MKIKKILAAIIAKIAFAAAKCAHNSTSSWTLYQPKEPEALRRDK